jgi:hypothetical protein
MGFRNVVVSLRRPALPADQIKQHVRLRGSSAPTPCPACLPVMRRSESP